MKPKIYETADFKEEKHPECLALFLSYFLYKKYGLFKINAKISKFYNRIVGSKLLFICEATKG